VIIVGTVRQGGGKAAKMMNVGRLARQLGYVPYPGTLNLWVTHEDKRALRFAPQRRSDGYVPCRVLGHPAHIHFPKGKWSVEVIGPVRFRDFVSDGDRVDVEVGE
jgi:CTP-dependent riboflavin kinase